MKSLFRRSSKQKQQETKSQDWQSFEVIEKVHVGKNTVQLTFSAKPFGSNVQEIFGGRGSHMDCAAEVDGKLVTRPYTPYVLPERTDAFELVVKSYPQGKLSKHIAALEKGQTLMMQGPLGGLGSPPSFDDTLCYVAAGTGITPMLQILYHRLSIEPKKRLPNVHLLFANHSEADIILREELSQLAERVQMHLSFVLSDAPSGWKQEVGRVNVPMLQSFMPPPGNSVRIFWCGPPGFHDHMRQCASTVGFSPSCIHEFGTGLSGGAAPTPPAAAKRSVGLSAGLAGAEEAEEEGEEEKDGFDEGSIGGRGGGSGTLAFAGDGAGSGSGAGAGSGAGSGAGAGAAAVQPVFVRVMSPGMPQNGDRKHISVQGRFVTVFREQGKLYCIDSICYHAGGPLTIGDIEDAAGHLCVVCPWHTYHVRLDTGQRMFRGLKPVDGKLVPTGWECAGTKQRVHEIEDRNEGVFVRLNLDGPELESDEYAYNARYTGNLGASMGGKRHVGSDGSMPKRNMQRSGHVMRQGGFANYRNKY